MGDENGDIRRYHFVDLDVDGEDYIKMFLKTYDMRVWIGFIWLRIGCNGGPL
jgi:hypothetical protein